MKTIYTEDAYLMHYGIKGQKKGRRRFQNEDGSLTPAGERRYLKGDDSSAQSISSSTEERVNRIKSAVARANDSYKSAQASAKLVADRAAAAYKTAQASKQLAADREAYRQNMIAAKKQRDEYAQRHAKESVANYRKNAAANTTYGTRFDNRILGSRFRGVDNPQSPYDLLSVAGDRNYYRAFPSKTSFKERSEEGFLNRYGDLSNSQRRAIERQQTKKDVGDKVNNFINKTTTSAKNTASNVANGVSEAKNNAVNAVKNTADNISNKISETKTNITNKISDKISSLKKEAEKAFNKATDKAMEKLYEAVESGAEFAYDSLNEIESRSSGSNGFEVSVNSGGSKITISVDDTTDIVQQGQDFINSLFGKR